MKITRKIGQSKPELVAPGNGCAAMPARVENRAKGASRGYHLWGPKRVAVSVQASVGYVGVDIKIWLVVVSRRLWNHRGGCHGTCGGASEVTRVR